MNFGMTDPLHARTFRAFSLKTNEQPPNRQLLPTATNSHKKRNFGCRESERLAAAVDP